MPCIDVMHCSFELTNRVVNDIGDAVVTIMSLVNAVVVVVVVVSKVVVVVLIVVRGNSVVVVVVVVAVVCLTVVDIADPVVDSTGQVPSCAEH